MIFEILSLSAEADDRGEKFRHYRSIPSLGEYLLLAQDRVVIDHYIRGDDGDTRQLRPFTDRHGTLLLPSVNVTLSIASIYRRIPEPAGVPGGA